MPLLNYLQFQPIDPSSDQDEIAPEHRIVQEIDLNEQIDEGQLEAFWNQVEQDIEQDPEWFNFSNE
jgi:hypothetical protein